MELSQNYQPISHVGLDTVKSLSDGARDSDLPKVGLLYNVDNSYQNITTTVGVTYQS